MTEKQTIEPQISVGVMVCSAKRPLMLKRCIQSIIKQELPENVSLEICVVENDKVAHSQAMLEGLQKSSSILLHYNLETNIGIPNARNRTLQIAIENQYDWIALIDDDEEAEPSWLRTLLNTAQTYQSDVVHGAVRRRYEQEPPKWWKRLKPVIAEAGHELNEAPTNNILLSTQLITPQGGNLRFDPLLTFGYEDIDFFSRAHEKGFKIVWSPTAIVEEYIPASRVQAERLISRVLNASAAHALRTRLRSGLLTAIKKFFPKLLRRIFLGALICTFTYPLFKLGFKNIESVYYKGRVRLARGIGNLSGLWHIKFNYYNSIDGE